MGAGQNGVHDRGRSLAKAGVKPEEIVSSSSRISIGTNVGNVEKFPKAQFILFQEELKCAFDPIHPRFGGVTRPFNGACSPFS